ncbi:MAG: LPS export ABC transporter permease LptG [Saccharospirillum sp.]|nr:LPS export ABC transporter permease LptG [Saccharospirillum sp.]
MTRSIINHYILKRTAIFIAIVVLAIGGLLLVMNVADEISRRGSEDYSAWDALLNELYGLPLYLYQFIGPMVLLGTLISVAGMAKSSELVIIQLASRSAAGLVLRLLLPGLILLAPIFYVGEWVAPQLRLHAEIVRADKLGRSRPTLSGEWYRDNQWIINADFISPDRVISGLTLFELDSTNQLTSVIYAQQAVPQANGWRLENARILEFATERTAQSFAEESLWFPENFNADLVSILSQRTRELTLSQLARQVRFATEQDQPNPELSLTYWNRFWFPIQYVGMLFLALAFSFGSFRQRTLGDAAFKGVALAIAIQLLTETAGSLLMVVGVPALLAALVPTGLFVGGAFWVLRRRL